MIKLVMSDLDGTLLKKNKTVSEATLIAVRALRSKDIKFGIATGRSLVAVERLIHTWGIAEYCDVLVGLNGGQIIERNQNIRSSNHELAGDVIRGILDRYDSLDVNVGIYRENTLYAKKAEFYAERLAKNNGFTLVITDFEELLQESQGKVLLMCDPSYMPVVQAFYNSNQSDQYRGFQSDEFLFELMDPAISKSYGINEVCKIYGITMDEVMVFGDNDNDIEMIRDAGIGICMANGSIQAKAVAKKIALSNEEDGLAVMIHEYLQNMDVKDI